MRQITSSLLLFFVLFTHSAIALDSYIPEHPSDHQGQMPDSEDNSFSMKIDHESCGDLGGHCSHSSAHTSGLFSFLQLLPLDLQPVFYSSLNPFLLQPQQTPPLRPPKTII